MFWCEHSYVAYSTTYIGYLTLLRKSAFYVGKKYHAVQQQPQTPSAGTAPGAVANATFGSPPAMGPAGRSASRYRRSVSIMPDI